MSALNRYTEIERLDEYKDEYKYSTFAVVRPDCDGGYFEDICYGVHLMPSDTVAFFILPECRY